MQTEPSLTKSWQGLSPLTKQPQSLLNPCPAPMTLGAQRSLQTSITCGNPAPLRNRETWVSRDGATPHSESEPQWTRDMRLQSPPPHPPVFQGHTALPRDTADMESHIHTPWDGARPSLANSQQPKAPAGCRAAIARPLPWRGAAHLMACKVLHPRSRQGWLSDWSSDFPTHVRPEERIQDCDPSQPTVKGTGQLHPPASPASPMWENQNSAKI